MTAPVPFVDAIEEARAEAKRLGPSGLNTLVPTSHALADQMARQVNEAASLPAYPYEALAPTGRRRKPLPDHGLTPPVWYRVLHFIRHGNAPEVAGSIAGVPPDLFEAWCFSVALDDHPLIRKFRVAIQHAEAVAEAALVQTVQKAATTGGNLDAARYLLEYRYPKRWSRAQRLEVTGPNGGPIQQDVRARHEVTVLTPEERMRRIEALKARALKRLAAGGIETAPDADGRYAAGTGDTLAPGAPFGHKAPQDREEYDLTDDADPDYLGTLSASAVEADTITDALPEDDLRHTDNPPPRDTDAFGLVDGLL